MSTQDYLGLSSPETHRVVSVSASQSLHASAAPVSPGVISTGLPRLDEAICRDALAGAPGPGSTARSMGVLCGHVTEVFGPPGVGKTSLALNIASNALREGRKVIWIDTGSPMPIPRLKDMLQNQRVTRDANSPNTPEDPAKNLTYFRAPSLPHLLAILLRPPKGFPPDDTALLVVDSFSGPFPSYFPNPTELRSSLSQAGITDKPQVQWLVNRKWNMTSDLGNALMKLATSHGLAALVINQTHTKIRGQPRATLCPVVGGGSWENNIYTRIVLYRNFADEERDGSAEAKVRFVEVMKRTGKSLMLRREENIVPFVIEGDGLREMGQNQQQVLPVSQKSEGPETASQRKRKVDEIADSQDEDEGSDGEYGWLDADGANLEEDASRNS